MKRGWNAVITVSLTIATIVLGAFGAAHCTDVAYTQETPRVTLQKAAHVRTQVMGAGGLVGSPSRCYTALRIEEGIHKGDLVSVVMEPGYCDAYIYGATAYVDITDLPDGNIGKLEVRQVRFIEQPKAVRK